MGALIFLVFVSFVTLSPGGLIDSEKRIRFYWQGPPAFPRPPPQSSFVGGPSWGPPPGHPGSSWGAQPTPTPESDNSNPISPSVQFTPGTVSVTQNNNPTYVAQTYSGWDAASQPNKESTDFNRIPGTLVTSSILPGQEDPAKIISSSTTTEVLASSNSECISMGNRCTMKDSCCKGPDNSALHCFSADRSKTSLRCCSSNGSYCAVDTDCCFAEKGTVCKGNKCS